MLFLLSNIVITSPNNYYLNIRLRRLTFRCLCSQQLKEPFHRLWILPTSQINYLQTKDESFSCPINTHRNHKKKEISILFDISFLFLCLYQQKRKRNTLSPIYAKGHFLFTYILFSQQLSHLSFQPFYFFFHFLIFLAYSLIILFQLLTFFFLLFVLQLQRLYFPCHCNA